MIRHDRRRAKAWRQRLVRVAVALALVVAAMGQGPTAQAATVSDLVITVSGPSPTAEMWTMQSYAWRVSNHGPDAADDAVVQLSATPEGLYWPSLWCSASGGAICPTFTASHSQTLTISRFPAGGVLVFSDRILMPGIGTDLVVEGTVTPAIDTDPDLTSNKASVTTTAVYVEPLPVVTIVHQEPDVETILGVPYTVTDVFSNAGTVAVNAAHLRASFLGGGVTSSWTAPHCVATGGAVCPAGLTAGSSDGDGVVFDLIVPTIPPGGRLAFDYSMTHRDPAPTCGDYYAARYRTTSDGPGLQSWYGVGAVFIAPLTDAYVDVTQAQHHATGGQPFTLSVEIGSACGRIDQLPFRWTLPPATALAVPDPLTALVCRRTYDLPCPVFSWDPTTRVLSTTLTDVGPGRYYLSLTGTAGLEPRSAWAASYELSNPSELIPETNRDETWFDIANPTWRMDVSVSLAPGSVVSPIDLVFSGMLHCVASGNQRWFARLPAGQREVTGTLLESWQGDSCTYAVDLPYLPTGYHWAGGLVASGTVVDAVYSNHLAAFSGRLVLDPPAVDPPVVAPPTVPVVVPPVAIPVTAVVPEVTATSVSPTTGLARTGSHVDGSSALAAGLVLVLGLVIVARTRRRRARA